MWHQDAFAATAPVPATSGAAAAGEIAVATDTAGDTTWSNSTLYAPAPSGDTTGAADTAAIQALINALTLGGTVVLGPGNYWVTGLTMKSRVYLRGTGMGATVLNLASRANADVIQGQNFSSLTLTGATTVAAGSNGVDISSWTSAAPGTLTVASTNQIPNGPGTLTVATATGNRTVTFTGTNGSNGPASRTSGTQFTGCVAVSAPAGSTLSTGGAVSLQNTGTLAIGGTVDYNSRIRVQVQSGQVLARWSRPRSGVNEDDGRRFPFKSYQLSKEGPTPVPTRVSPTDRIHARIDELFAQDRPLPEILEDVARLGAQLLMQADRAVDACREGEACAFS